MTRASTPAAASAGSGSRTTPASRTTSRPGPLRRLRGGLRSHLDRPMTSLHLVVAIFVLLLAIGLTMVLSSSSAAAYKTSTLGSPFATVERQVVFAALGLVCFLVAARMPIRAIRAFSTTFVMICLVLLVAVLVPGIGIFINGARSWIGIGPLSFQPSELAKLALLLWSAHVFAARRSSLRRVKELFFPVIPVTLLMGGLIYLQPDVGTLVTLAIVIAAVLWFAGAPMRWFAGAGALGLAGILYLSVSADYRLNRIKALIDPSAYPDVSFQLRQGLYGMGRGGWFGVGLGESRAKWAWLPYADSDFIFAIIGEELGLIGAGLVIALFALLAYTGLRISRRSVEPFAKIAAGACTVWLVGQASINIGYVVGALPTTGLTLPMISSGGTSLIVTMAVFGLLANFARAEPAAAAALREHGPGRLSRWLGWGTTDVDAMPRRTRAKRTAGAVPERAGTAQTGTARTGTARTGAARTGTAPTARTAPVRTGAGSARTTPLRTPPSDAPGGTPRRPPPRGAGAPRTPAPGTAAPRSTAPRPAPRPPAARRQGDR